MYQLSHYAKDKLIDLLSERLVFERAGVKLYDTIIEKIEKDGDPAYAHLLMQIRDFRDEEKEHEEWLESQIRELGGTAHEKTEHAELVLRESVGIEAVISQDSEPAHLFHALLAAELVDNTGWDLLVDLASEAADEEALRDFQRRRSEEQDHLAYVRAFVAAGARRDVLGRDEIVPILE